MRDSNAEMAQALGAFTDASVRAQAEFAALKITGEKAATALQERTASARVEDPWPCRIAARLGSAASCRSCSA